MRRRQPEAKSARAVVPASSSTPHSLGTSGGTVPSLSTKRRVVTPRQAASVVVSNFFDNSQPTFASPSTRGLHASLRPELIYGIRHGTTANSSGSVSSSTLPPIASASPRQFVPVANASKASAHVTAVPAGSGVSPTVPSQRAQFPIKSDSMFNESNVGIFSRVTQHRAEELMTQYHTRRAETLRVIREHCSVDMYSEKYDAISGAEDAILYVNRPITEEDFRQPTKQSDFDSRFADMMMLFMHNDIEKVIGDALGGSSSPTKKGSSSLVPTTSAASSLPVDYASLRYVSKQFLEGQEGATVEAKKRTLYKSFRVQQQSKLDHDDPLAATVSTAGGADSSPTATTAPFASPATTFSTTGADAGDDDNTWQESDGTDSEDDDVS